MNLRRASLLAVPLAALAIAGCGGGDDKTESTATTTETTAALSKADYVTQGDAICGSTIPLRSLGTAYRKSGACVKAAG